MTEETLVMLEQRAAVVRSPSVRLLCAEVRRLRAALEEVTQERDAISSVFDAYTGDCDALRVALVTALIPLEALHGTELDNRWLAPTTKEAIRDAVRAGRAALLGREEEAGR